VESAITKDHLIRVGSNPLLGRPLSAWWRDASDLNHLFSPPISNSVFGCSVLNSTIPADLFELNTRFETWRANRETAHAGISDSCARSQSEPGVRVDRQELNSIFEKLSASHESGPEEAFKKALEAINAVDARRFIRKPSVSANATQGTDATCSVALVARPIGQAQDASLTARTLPRLVRPNHPQSSWSQPRGSSVPDAALPLGDGG
jgi:hypothetical protein